MNDLDLMEKFRAEVPPADLDRMARARARMFRTEPPRRAARWVWRVAPPAALAAAAAVAVVAIQAPSGSTPLSPSGTGPAAGSPAPGSTADASHLLLLAAAEARQQPVLTARPDQFVYVESKVAWAGVVVGAPPKSSTGPGGSSHPRSKYVPPLEKTRRVWISADGSRDGLLKETPLTKPSPDQRRFSMLTDTSLGKGQAAYRRDLPTDAKAMRTYLYATDHGGNSRDAGVWSYLGELLREEYLPPASVAALYEAAATIPGTSVVRNQVDSAGRHGTAVSYTDAGIRHDLIFDASTYQFLGERDVVVGDFWAFPKNAVIGYTAQLKIAIVDKPGQLP
jgi:hypothetical protein